mmetsp:Transcript_11133/g.26543  ORF Transcript_11133/g.26543 Transcript_11133/m.26543 type:complete len:217 (-) Transcript_11133:178-828(-)
MRGAVSPTTSRLDPSDPLLSSSTSMAPGRTGAPGRSGAPGGSRHIVAARGGVGLIPSDELGRACNGDAGCETDGVLSLVPTLPGPALVSTTAVPKFSPLTPGPRSVRPLPALACGSPVPSGAARGAPDPPSTLTLHGSSSASPRRNANPFPTASLHPACRPSKAAMRRYSMATSLVAPSVRSSFKVRFLRLPSAVVSREGGFATSTTSRTSTQCHP